MSMSVACSRNRRITSKMALKSGSIVNSTSEAGLAGWVITPYVASKHADSG